MGDFDNKQRSSTIRPIDGVSTIGDFRRSVAKRCSPKWQSNGPIAVWPGGGRSDHGVPLGQRDKALAPATLDPASRCDGAGFQSTEAGLRLGQELRDHRSRWQDPSAGTKSFPLRPCVSIGLNLQNRPVGTCSSLPVGVPIRP